MGIIGADIHSVIYSGYCCQLNFWSYTVTMNGMII